MTLTSLLIFLLVGTLAGFAASKMLKGHGMGLLGNLAAGIVGSFLGGILLGLLGVSLGGWIGSFVTATLGALVLLAIVQLVANRSAYV